MLLIGPPLGAIFVYSLQRPNKFYRWACLGTAWCCLQRYEKRLWMQLKYKVVSVFVVHTSLGRVTLAKQLF